MVMKRRPGMVNRLPGELTRQDTEAFFRRHPEFFRLVVSRYYPLNEDLSGRFADVWDWHRLTWNKGLPWSEALIERYTERWECEEEWEEWSEELNIERYADRWDWEELSRNEGLPWSEPLIGRYADRWD